MGKHFETWGEKVNEAEKMLNGVIDSDRKRWKDMHSNSNKTDKSKSKDKKIKNNNISYNEVDEDYKSFLENLDNTEKKKKERKKEKEENKIVNN